MNRPSNLCCSFLLSLGTLLLAPGLTFAQTEDAAYGYFRTLEGSTTLAQAGDGAQEQAEVNQPILAGDRLWVAPRGRAELALPDRTLLRLEGGTEVVLAALAFSPERQDRATHLQLTGGVLQLVVPEDALGEELPRVDTPNATVYVQEPGSYLVRADERAWTEVVVRRGYAEVVTQQGSAVARAGEVARIEGERLPEVVIAAAGPLDGLERWGDQLLAQAQGGRVRYVDDRLQYAAAPLSSHGDWVDVGGRRAWRPYAAAGWRPYHAGWWASTPTGLSWVSSEPWGWVPYHYGTWDLAPHYGWVWYPGHAFAPAWVYWYWGPRFVGWCPVGYYTRFYGPRFHDFGFRFGVHGWAGGSWKHFGHWNFVSVDHFGGRRGRGHHRHGSEFAHRRGFPELGRGIITTDTRGITPARWNDPAEVVEVLARRAGARNTRPGRAGGGLPDVTPFVARQPELPPDVTRVVVAERPGAPAEPGARGGRPLRVAPREPLLEDGELPLPNPRPDRTVTPPRQAQPTQVDRAPQRPAAGEENWRAPVRSRRSLQSPDPGGDERSRPPTARSNDSTARPLGPPARPSDSTARPLGPTARSSDSTAGSSDSTARPIRPSGRSIRPLERSSGPTARPVRPSGRSSEAVGSRESAGRVPAAAPDAAASSWRERFRPRTLPSPRGAGEVRAPGVSTSGSRSSSGVRRPSRPTTPAVPSVAPGATSSGGSDAWRQRRAARPARPAPGPGLYSAPSGSRAPARTSRREVPVVRRVIDGVRSTRSVAPPPSSRPPSAHVAPPARRSSPPSSRVAPPARPSSPPSARVAPPTRRSAPPSARVAPPARRWGPPTGSLRQAAPPTRATPNRPQAVRPSPRESAPSPPRGTSVTRGSVRQAPPAARSEAGGRSDGGSRAGSDRGAGRAAGSRSSASPPPR